MDHDGIDTIIKGSLEETSEIRTVEKRRRSEEKSKRRDVLVS